MINELDSTLGESSLLF